MNLDEANPHEPSFPERWLATVRVVAMGCACAYGVLALGALIALNGLVWLRTGADLPVVGALFGIVAAFLAYLNFSAILSMRQDALVMVTLYGSIGAGVLSALMFAASALA